MSVTVNGSSGLTFNDGSTQNTSPFTGGLGFRNRIINGDFRIDQRNAGASVSVQTSTGYTLDRWTAVTSQNSKYSVQRSSGLTGFANSLLVTSSSAYTVGSGDYMFLAQYIEGFNVADLGWGTANAQTVTLSFKVKSSLTGTFGGMVGNADQNRSYPFTFTINAANTEETKTITIAGDTTGTWGTGNGTGIAVRFGIGVGSTYLGTAGAWSGSQYFSATGSTNIVATNGATFYITGVQLEKGSTATSFDYRPYGTELQLCQRYYETCSGMIHYCFMATSAASSAFKYSNLQWIVTKRTAPTVSLTGAGTNASGFTANSPSVNQTGWYCNQTTTGSDAYLTAYSASAEL